MEVPDLTCPVAVQKNYGSLGFAGSGNMQKDNTEWL